MEDHTYLELYLSLLTTTKFSAKKRKKKLHRYKGMLAIACSNYHVLLSTTLLRRKQDREFKGLLHAGSTNCTMEHWNGESPRESDDIEGNEILQNSLRNPLRIRCQIRCSGQKLQNCRENDDLICLKHWGAFNSKQLFISTF
jgi:hypothetical protein